MSTPDPTAFMPQVAPAPPAARRFGPLARVGVLIAVVGVVAGVVLYGMSGSRAEDAVRKLARAPAGCTTTLDFEKTGTFIVYVETKGEVGDVAGDCPGNGASYERDADDLPEVTLRLVDPDDAEVDLDDKEGVRYDAGGFRGTSIHSVRIEQEGRHRLTVTSDDTDFAIAIGKDPEGDASSMKTMGIAVAVAALVVGVLLLVFGRRKRPVQPAPSVPAAGPAPWQAAPQPAQPQSAAPPAGTFAPPQPPGQGWGAPPST